MMDTITEIRASSGISANRYETMFEPLSTSISPYESTGEGAGIGLYIARSLAHRHGGTIELRSPPGTGAQFVVFLPSEPPETVPG
jgi:signal transduction histidine kinase